MSYEVTELDLDLTIEEGSLPVKPEELPLPYVYLEDILSNAQTSFILKITGQEELNEENSLPFYIRVQGELTEVGRFDISNLKAVTKFKFMKMKPLLKIAYDRDPVDLSHPDQMIKMIKIDKSSD